MLDERQRADPREHGGRAADAGRVAGDRGPQRGDPGRGPPRGAGDPDQRPRSRRRHPRPRPRGGRQAGGGVPQPRRSDAARGDGAGPPAASAGGRRSGGHRRGQDRAQGTRPGVTGAPDRRNVDRGIVGGADRTLPPRWLRNLPGGAPGRGVEPWQAARQNGTHRRSSVWPRRRKRSTSGRPISRVSSSMVSDDRAAYYLASPNVPDDGEAEAPRCGARARRSRRRAIWRACSSSAAGSKIVPELAEIFDQLVLDERGIAIAEVTTAEPLDAAGPGDGPRPPQADSSGRRSSCA